MSRLCEELHELMSTQPRFYFPSNDINIPQNGIFLIFENGETAHGKDRIVMVGTHSSENNLMSRLKQHYIIESKDGSIFRKNIGRCILNVRKDPYIRIWDVDLSQRTNKEQYKHLINEEYQKSIEREVSWYIKENFSFCVIGVDDKTYRLKLKAKLVATISQCEGCRPTSNWFGLNSPVQRIKENGMWQEKELEGEQITKDELEVIKNICNTQQKNI